VKVPAAVVVTSKDSAVSPRKQRELAGALHASLFEAPIDHLEVTTRGDLYNGPLLEAIRSVEVRDRAGVR
jgi:hypothetical protein